MTSSSPRYPPEFRNVLRHADRFAKLLVRLEREERGGAWVVGRSGELRAFVSCAIADWRGGILEHERALGAITSYVDGLHRAAAERLRCSVLLKCCMADDAITMVPDDEVVRTLATTLGGAPSESPTARAGWVDEPEVLQRFGSEIARVEVHARMLARRLGTRSVTIDDLRGFGREGLLDAARCFDQRRGVPFEHWATLRIRSAMIDGVRQWGGLPRRAVRELQALEPPGSQGTSEADNAPRARPAGVAAGILISRLPDESAALSDPRATPEDVVSNAQLHRVLREIVRQLPEAERKVIEGYYFAGLTLKQVGAMAGATESWASRILARAIEKMQSDLRKRDRKAIGPTKKSVSIRRAFE